MYAQKGRGPPRIRGRQRAMIQKLKQHKGKSESERGTIASPQKTKAEREYEEKKNTSPVERRKIEKARGANSLPKFTRGHRTFAGDQTFCAGWTGKTRPVALYAIVASIATDRLC